MTDKRTPISLLFPFSSLTDLFLLFIFRLFQYKSQYIYLTSKNYHKLLSIIKKKIINNVRTTIIMASSSSLLCVFLLLLSSSVLCSALDMSIIDEYYAKHVIKRDVEYVRHVRDMYESWLVRHGKSHNKNVLGLGERERRFMIFMDNLNFIDQHNMAQNRSFNLGLNRFADLTHDEFRSMYLGAKMNRSNRLLTGARKSDRYAYLAGDQLPETVDWRANGAVVGVKDQGPCG